MIELNRTYSLDLGAQAPVEVRTKEFTETGVLCEYLNSWTGREEIVDYELFEINGINTNHKNLKL